MQVGDQLKVTALHREVVDAAGHLQNVPRRTAAGHIWTTCGGTHAGSRAQRTTNGQACAHTLDQSYRLFERLSF
jgi:hypothetical protein